MQIIQFADITPAPCQIQLDSIFKGSHLCSSFSESEREKCVLCWTELVKRMFVFHKLLKIIMQMKAELLNLLGIRPTLLELLHSVNC